MFSGMTGMLRRYINTTCLAVQLGATFPSAVCYQLRRHWPFGRCCMIKFRDGTWLSAPVDTPLLQLIEEIWLRRCYSTGPLREGAVVVDIGANVGTFAVWLAKMHSVSRIIAVEPDPTNIRFLERNMQANGLTNIVPVRMACAAMTGKATLHTGGLSVLYSFYPRDGKDFVPAYQTGTISLDDLFEQYEVSSCDLLKLDCEGAEYDILLKASLHALSSVGRIALEYHVGFTQHAPEDLEQRLHDVGFEVERLPMRPDETGMMYAVNPAFCIEPRLEQMSARRV